jgi:hypothetical protein
LQLFLPRACADAAPFAAAKVLCVERNLSELRRRDTEAIRNVIAEFEAMLRHGKINRLKNLK